MSDRDPGGGGDKRQPAHGPSRPIRSLAPTSARGELDTQLETVAFEELSKVYGNQVEKRVQISGRNATDKAQSLLGSRDNPMVALVLVLGAVYWIGFDYLAGGVLLAAAFVVLLLSRRS